MSGKTAEFGAIQVDQQAHLLYVADRTDSGVDIVDLRPSPGRYVATVHLPALPRGVALAAEFQRLYAGLDDGSVAAIQVGSDPAGDKVTDTVRTGVKAAVGLLDYDGKEHKVYAANGDGSITSIDAGSARALKRFNVGPGVDQPRYDPVDGKIYASGPGSDFVYRVDPARDEVVQKAAVGNGCQPAGIAINPATGLALLGCRSATQQQVLVWNLQTGKYVSSLEDAGGAALVVYDAVANRYFVAAPNNSGGAEIAIFNASPVGYFTSVKTKAGGSSVAYDEYNRMVYTPDQRAGKGQLLGFRVPAC